MYYLRSSARLIEEANEGLIHVIKKFISSLIQTARKRHRKEPPRKPREKILRSNSYDYRGRNRKTQYLQVMQYVQHFTDKRYQSIRIYDSSPTARELVPSAIYFQARFLGRGKAAGRSRAGGFLFPHGPSGKSTATRSRSIIESYNQTFSSDVCEKCKKYFNFHHLISHAAALAEKSRKRKELM